MHKHVCFLDQISAPQLILHNESYENSQSASGHRQRFSNLEPRCHHQHSSQSFTVNSPVKIQPYYYCFKWINMLQSRQKSIILPLCVFQLGNMQFLIIFLRENIFSIFEYNLFCILIKQNCDNSVNWWLTVKWRVLASYIWYDIWTSLFNPNSAPNHTSIAA